MTYLKEAMNKLGEWISRIPAFADELLCFTHLDLTEEFAEVMEEIMEQSYFSPRLVVFSSPDDYDRDVEYVWSCNPRDFYLDPNYHDGHFRV